ncbi:GNAT family N-acetyltransferase [Neisseriaceae bacterium B1]
MPAFKDLVGLHPPYAFSGSLKPILFKNNHVVPNLIIRPERESDFHAIDDLLAAAFANDPHSDGGEGALTRRLRDDKHAYLPELACVAELDGDVVSYVLLTKVQLALAPLAVSLTQQGRGIGGALVLHAHDIAQELGYEYCILLGEPEYYARFGYEHAVAFGIRTPFDVPEQYYQVHILNAP